MSKHKFLLLIQDGLCFTLEELLNTHHKQKVLHTKVANMFIHRMFSSFSFVYQHNMC